MLCNIYNTYTCMYTYHLRCKIYDNDEDKCVNDFFSAKKSKNRVKDPTRVPEHQTALGSPSRGPVHGQ